MTDTEAARLRIAKQTYETIFLAIDTVIDTEVGEQREYKPETIEVLNDLHGLVLTILNLPDDHVIGG
jgi:hypothetical protein